MPYQTANPFANLMQAEMFRQQMEMDKRRMAQSEKQNALQLLMQQQQFQEGQQTRDATREVFEQIGYADPNDFTRDSGRVVSEAARTRPYADVSALAKVAGGFKPETGDQFTLSEGQVRFGADGRPVASLPKTEDPFKDLSGDAKNLAAILGRKPTVKELADYRASGASNINLGQTKGREAADKKFAEEYVDYVATGGYADTMKQLGQLRGVVRSLKSGKNLTGPVVGNVPDIIGTVTNPEAVDTRETVEEVVQRNLRLVLGAQFTEKEGERLIARAYNPKLSEEQNVKRLNRLIGQMEKAARSKKDAADYFEQNGTLTGWKGKTPTVEDFYSAVAPQAGDVEDGYRFTGGDPSNPNSWKKVN